MEPKTELKFPEFKTYTFESFGQLLKVSASIPPDYFPYKVELPLKTQFFKDIKGRLLNGEGGSSIEHTAVLGVNDIGEVLVSNKIFKGDGGSGFTDVSGPQLQEHVRMLKSVPLPAGWRTFGIAHSHPLNDIFNHLDLLFSKNIPSVGGIPVTWSGGDLRSLLSAAETGHLGFTTYAMINPTQINFMVATSETVSKLKNPDSELESILNSKSDVPQYKSFSKLGIILYGGNYFGKNRGETTLERLV